MIDELDLSEMKAELSGINLYGRNNDDYITLSKFKLGEALEELSNLLDAVRAEDDEEYVPSGLVQFRYDGGSKSEDEIYRKDKALVTSVVLDWKENHGQKLQIKPLPYHEFENNGPGLRICRYGTLDWTDLKG